MTQNLNKKQLILKRIESGETIASVSKTEHISILRIQRWVREFHSSGRDLTLFAEEQSIAHYQVLTSKQIKWLYFVLLNKTPELFDFDSFLWNKYLIEKLVLKWCKKTYDRTTLYRLITDIGFNFQELDPKLISLKNSNELSHYRENNFQFYFLNVQRFKKSFKLLKDPNGTTGTIVQKVKESDTKFDIVHAHSLHKKGIKFQVRANPFTEGMAVEFIERFSKETKSNYCFLTPKDCVFASPDFIDYAKLHFPRVAFVIIN